MNKSCETIAQNFLVPRQTSVDCDVDATVVESAVQDVLQTVLCSGVVRMKLLRVVLICHRHVDLATDGD